MTVVEDNQIAWKTGERLRTITRLFTQLQQLNFACCDVVSATQCSLLSTLERNGPQTLTSLTRSLQLDKAWLSRTTDQMVEDGLLLKAPHPNDRRALLVQLTDAGHGAAQILNHQLNAQASRVLERLPAGERSQTVRLLSLLETALQAELASQVRSLAAPAKGEQE
ncbi:MarR family transcriptional regulator [Deinococcus sp.]|uniref:MarR family winged helix-turn-helix transcriptional regulator n=1 Tax=Deinococcus sp. TaxID=47478 RepID=UPI0025BABC0D|nr:MarR family transcriptional regulator [Deinococcus sp.]